MDHLMLGYNTKPHISIDFQFQVNRMQINNHIKIKTNTIIVQIMMNRMQALMTLQRKPVHQRPNDLSEIMIHLNTMIRLIFELNMGAKIFIKRTPISTSKVFQINITSSGSNAPSIVCKISGMP